MYHYYLNIEWSPRKDATLSEKIHCYLYVPGKTTFKQFHLAIQTCVPQLIPRTPVYPTKTQVQFRILPICKLTCENKKALYDDCQLAWILEKPSEKDQDKKSILSKVLCFEETTIESICEDDNFHDRVIEYKPEGKWLSETTVIRQLGKVKDNNGQYLMLLGRLDSKAGQSKSLVRQKLKQIPCGNDKNTDEEDSVVEGVKSDKVSSKQEKRRNYLGEEGDDTLVDGNESDDVAGEQDQSSDFHEEEDETPVEGNESRVVSGEKDRNNDLDEEDRSDKLDIQVEKAIEDLVEVLKKVAKKRPLERSAEPSSRPEKKSRRSWRRSYKEKGVGFAVDLDLKIES